MIFWRRKNFRWLLMALLLAGCYHSPTITPLPTATITAASPTHFPTETALPATPTPTSSPTIAPTIPATRPPETGGLAIAFIGETVPDGTNLQPGQAFQKTWTLKNGGKRAWVEGFSLARVSSNPAGEDLGSPDVIPLAQEVRREENVQISIDLVAPEQDGRYTVYFQLQDETGAAVPDSQIWVTIMVGSGGSASTHGISATLTNFISNPQSATVSLCMTVPDRNYALDRAPSLLIDQLPAPFLDGGTISPWGCYEFKYQISAAELDQVQRVTLSIEGSLRMSPPPGDPDAACKSARLNLMAQYPGLDFQCHFSMAGYYTNLKLPAGMTTEQAKRMITDAIEGAIYGPWVLTIR